MELAYLLVLLATFVLIAVVSLYALRWLVRAR
jgi:hypothetical protein